MIGSPHAALKIHFLLGKLLYSTSNGAIYFLLCLFISTALPAGFWCRRNERPVRESRLWLLPLVLLVGNLVNIWSFLVYRKLLDLPLRTHFYHWSDNLNSFCYLLHNHTAKTALALLTGLLGLEKKVTAFDTGQVFYAHVPEFIPWTLAGLLLSALGLFLAFLPQVLHRHQYGFVAFLLYFFSFSGCLKSMVDGGPLSYRFLPSFIVLLSLLAARDTDDLLRQCRQRWGILFAVVMLPVMILWHFLPPEPGTTALAPFVFLCVFFLLLLLLVKSPRSRSNGWGVVLAAGFLLFATAAEYFAFDASLFRTIDAHHQVVKVDFADFTATDVSVDCRGLKVYETYLRYDNDPLKPKNLLIWDNRDPGLRSMNLIVKPLAYAGDSGGFPAQGLLTFQRVDKVDSIANALYFSITSVSGIPPIFSSSRASLFSRSNHYCYLHLLGNLFTASGFREFILIPPAGAYAN